MIESFKGFRGTCAMVQIGKIQFCLMAKNPKQLQTLWASVLKGVGPLEDDMCRRAVLVEANLLPRKTSKANQPFTGES